MGLKFINLADVQCRESCIFTMDNFHSPGTPLPSVSSSPQHYCEVTHTRTPHPGRKSLDMLADRLSKL